MIDQRGLMRKFIVTRVDGSSFPGGKHEHCEYFVMDLNHDRHAMPALAAYCVDAEAARPALVADLRARYALQSLSFQARVQPWLIACFGEMIAGDREERNHRFLEEAIELVQSCGCTASEAHQLVDYVFGRPVGEPRQESGGVSVTHAALCLANGIDMDAAAEAELARVWTKVEAIRAKQAAKPKHSPLPETPRALTPADINELLADAAKAYAVTHAVAAVGDVVETTWCGWKRPQKVRITSVGAHLVCRYNDAAEDWIAGFAMNYIAQRLKKDGTTKERNEGGGIVLGNLKTADGREWLRGGRWGEENGFNHAGLTWSTSRDRRIASSKGDRP